MRTRYDESAQRLAQQKKQRMRVIRRRKIVENLAAGVIVVALSVGMAFMLVDGLDKEWEYQDRKMEAYRAEMNINNISPEERAQAEKEYYEDYYSAKTIGNLKVSVISEYGVLIDAIVENEALKVSGNVKPLDSNRLDKTVAEYGGFKTTCEQDKVNYAGEPEDQRMSKTSSLYNTKQDILEDQLTEATQKGKHLVQDSAEYLKNQEEIENINHKINTIKSSLDVVGERSMTIMFEKKAAEEDGFQK